MKDNRATLLVTALLSTLLLGGCGNSDSTASDADQKMFKNPVKGTPPTAEQLKASANVPTHIGPNNGTPIGKAGAGSAPAEAMKTPGAPGG